MFIVAGMKVASILPPCPPPITVTEIQRSRLESLGKYFDNSIRTAASVCALKTVLIHEALDFEIYN